MPAEDRRVPGNEAVIEAVALQIGERVEQHVAKYHRFTGDQLEGMVREHRELYDDVAPLARDTNEKVTLLVNEMYGTPHPTAADPDRRQGGMAETLKRLEVSATTGGFKVQRAWSSAQWAFFGTIGASIVAAMTAIVVALINGAG
jgi:hypothetical protein